MAEFRTAPLHALFFFAASAPACQPSEVAGLHREAVCGERGRARLLDLPHAVGASIVGRVDDRIVVRVEDDSGIEHAHAVGPCGEDPVALDLPGGTAAFGDWLLTYARHTGRVGFADVHTGEHHPLLSDVYPMVRRMARAWRRTMVGTEAAPRQTRRHWPWEGRARCCGRPGRRYGRPARSKRAIMPLTMSWIHWLGSESLPR